MKKRKPLTNKEGEVRELTQADINAMRPAHEVLPPEFIATFPKRKQGERGAQKTPIKVALTVRYSPEVIAYFKATGSGWQKRMDEALKNWIKKHPKAA
jgi:uncharacterized protein (DUF4415 family)